jgi:hypothetical protein
MRRYSDWILAPCRPVRSRSARSVASRTSFFTRRCSNAFVFAVIAVAIWLAHRHETQRGSSGAVPARVEHATHSA